MIHSPSRGYLPISKRGSLIGGICCQYKKKHAQLDKRGALIQGWVINPPLTILFLFVISHSNSSKTRSNHLLKHVPGFHFLVHMSLFRWQVKIPWTPDWHDEVVEILQSKTLELRHEGGRYGAPLKQQGGWCLKGWWITDMRDLEYVDSFEDNITSWSDWVKFWKTDWKQFENYILLHWHDDLITKLTHKGR